MTPRLSPPPISGSRWEPAEPQPRPRQPTLSCWSIGSIAWPRWWPSRAGPVSSPFSPSLAGMGMSAAAMAVASLGWLPPVAGALLQEAIDIAVILNALRALAGDPGRKPLSSDARVPRLMQDHARLRALLARIRHTADELLQGGHARDALRRIDDELCSLLIPHQQAEERTVFPGTGPSLGRTRSHRADDPDA